VNGLGRTYHKAQKLFWMHPKEHLGDVGYVESRFFPLGDSVSFGARLVHGLAKRTIGSTIIFDALDGTLR
jgi:hypothetical protein